MVYELSTQFSNSCPLNKRGSIVKLLKLHTKDIYKLLEQILKFLIIEL